MFPLLVFCVLMFLVTVRKHFLLVKIRPDFYSHSFHFPKVKKEPWGLWRSLYEEQRDVFFPLFEERAGFSPHCVWHLSTLVWAWLRPCLVSLPSSISFPDFLCMLRFTAGLCERLLATGTFTTIFLTFNPQLKIPCRGKRGLTSQGIFQDLNFSQMRWCQMTFDSPTQLPISTSGV